MKVLLTGGTGFVGQAVLRELTAEGHWTALLTRYDSSGQLRAPTQPFAGEAVAGDIQDVASLTHVFSAHKLDAVIHLIGIISESRSITFDAVHTEGTKNVVQAAHAAGVRRFVHMSALGTRPGARSRYHKTKWAAEQIVRSSAMDWTIFRPSLIYGPGDHLLSMFRKISRVSPVMIIPGSGTTRFQPIEVTQVAKAFVSALDTPESFNQTYDLCGPDTLTLPEIIDTILRADHRTRLKLRLPRPVAKIQAAVLEFLMGKLLNTPPPLNRDQLLMLEEDNTGNGLPADVTFVLVHRPFAENLRSAL